MTAEEYDRIVSKYKPLKEKAWEEYRKNSQSRTRKFNQLV